MKKITLLTFSVLSAVVCLSNLDGALPENTAAPGELTCGRAPCHNVPINVGDAQVSLTFAGGETTYQPDSTYLLKIKIDNPQTGRNGFQILALDEDIENVGAWELIEPDKMKIISGIGLPDRKYVTHQAPGNQQDEWTLHWKAPAGDVGQVTFYCSVLSANDNGMNTGDEVYNTSLAVDFALPSLTDEAADKMVKIYPKLVTVGVWVELPVVREKFKLSLHDLNGALLSEQKVQYGGLHFMETEGLAGGLYLLRVEGGGMVEVERVFVR